MSKLYLVSYDFKDPLQDRAGFYEALQRFEAWWHFIDGTWLITTDRDAKGIQESLGPFLDDDVNLLILEAGNDMAGWLPEAAWEWIRKRRGSPVS